MGCLVEQADARAVCVFLPLVIAYTGWVYRVLRGPVSAEDIAGNSHAHY